MSRINIPNDDIDNNLWPKFVLAIMYVKNN